MFRNPSRYAVGPSGGFLVPDSLVTTYAQQEPVACICRMSAATPAYDKERADGQITYHTADHCGVTRPRIAFLPNVNAFPVRLWGDLTLTGR